MIKCPKCGYVSSQYDLKGDNRYCVNCGAELESNIPLQSSQPVISESVTPFVNMPPRPVAIAAATSPQTAQSSTVQPVSPQITQTPISPLQPQIEYIIPSVDWVMDENNLEKDEKELLAKHYRQIPAYFHSGEVLISSIPLNLGVPNKGMLHELIDEYNTKRAETFKVQPPELVQAEKKKTIAKEAEEKATGEVFNSGDPEKYVAALTNDRLLLSRFETKELKSERQSGIAQFNLMMEIPLNLIKTTDFNSSTTQETRKIPFLKFLILGSIFTGVGLLFYFLGYSIHSMVGFGIFMLFAIVPEGVIFLIIALYRLLKAGFFYVAKEEYLRIRYADPVLDKDSWVKLFSVRKYSVNKQQIAIDTKKYWKKINAVYLNNFYRTLSSTRKPPQ